jgi:hypothetical protein
MKTFSLSRLIAALFLCFACLLSAKAQIRFRSYNPGHYYDIAGVKHTGFIDFGKNFWGTPKINFKPDSLGAENQKIDLAAMKSLVVTHKAEEVNVNDNPTETDSIQAAKVEALKKADPTAAPAMVTDSFVVVKEASEYFTDPVVELCKFVVGSVNSKIYSREEARSTPGVGMMFGSIGAVAVSGMISGTYYVTIYLCEIDGATVKLKRGNYRDLLSRAFSDDPDLVKKIQTKEIRYGELETMIDLYVRFKSPTK